MTYIVTISLTRRLSKLAFEMHNLDTSTFQKEITPSSRDEIGILTQNFNYMLTKISMLLDEKYELGQTVKNAELIALQAQINPHFLYNTLDQLYWMGIRYNVPDISNLVIDLSKFYKLSLVLDIF
jgi:two-component system sensor histidine kinase YesM